VKINGIEFCGDEERMGKVAREFAMKSNFVINGCIGAIDGWIVYSDPASYFSRKGFFGQQMNSIPQH
jgi:hypothetical protein